MFNATRHPSIKFPGVLFILGGILCLCGALQAQEGIEKVSIQRAPGVEKLRPEDRFVATLRAASRSVGALHFEVLPLKGSLVAEPLLRGVLNKDGVARVELPKSEGQLEGDYPGIRARLVEPGFQMRMGGRRDRRYKPHRESGEWSCYLPTERGSSALVQLVNGAGQSKVANLEWRRSGDPLSLLDPSVTLDAGRADGWYSLHVTEDIRLDLIALRNIRTGCMAGTVLGVDFRLSAPPQRLKLIMRGIGQARGRVRYANGSSPKELTIVAHWAGPLDVVELLDLCSRPLNDWALQSQGLIHRFLWIDSEGEFLADGLLPGHYRFEAHGQWLRSTEGKGLFAVSGTDSSVPLFAFELPKKKLPTGDVLGLHSPFDDKPARNEKMGTLEVRAIAKGMGISSDVDMQVFRRADGEQVYRTGPASGLLEVDLPPGKYRVRAVGAQPMAECNFEAHSPRRLGESEMEVEVFQGKRTKQDLEIAAGGFLSINLMGKAGANDRLAALQDMSTSPSLQFLGPLSLRASRPTIHLVSESGSRSIVAWYPPTGLYNRGAEHLWPLNEMHRSECLPTGTFQLLARLPGGRTAQAEVTIESKRTTDVTLRFED